MDGLSPFKTTATQLEPRIATSFSELENWGAAYERFLAAVGDYGIFYQKGWMRAIWPAYSLKPSSLFFIGLWRGEDLLALAPFQLMHKGPLQGWRQVLTVFGSQHPTLSNPWPDLLILQDRERALCIGEILKTLAICSRQWDEIELLHLPAESLNLPLLQHAWTGTSFVADENPSAQINLSQGFTEYQARLSRNLCKELRRLRQRLETDAQVEFLCTDRLSPSRWQQIRQMHLSRQQRLNRKGQERSSIFANESEADALRLALDWAEQHGQARHYWLDVDCRPAAFALGVHCGASYFYYFIGMDERVEPYSGGKLLLLHLIEEEALHGTQSIELFYGLSRNKARFANQQRALCHCRHENTRAFSLARNRWVQGMKKIRGWGQLLSGHHVG